MYVTCCIADCSAQLSSVETFLIHLDEHRPPSNFQYRCPFPGCPQLFTKTYPFKRHFKQHVFPSIEDQNVLLTSEMPSTSRSTASEECYNVPEKIQRVDDNIKDVQNFTRNYQEVKESAISFTLALHKKKNFFRDKMSETSKKQLEAYVQSLPSVFNL